MRAPTAAYHIESEFPACHAGFGSGAAAEGTAKPAEGGEEDGAAGEEEECSAEFKPVVQLDEVEVQVRELDGQRR